MPGSGFDGVGQGLAIGRGNPDIVDTCCKSWPAGAGSSMLRESHPHLGGRWHGFLPICIISHWSFTTNPWRRRLDHEMLTADFQGTLS